MKARLVGDTTEREYTIELMIYTLTMIWYVLLVFSESSDIFGNAMLLTIFITPTGS